MGPQCESFAFNDKVSRRGERYRHVRAEFRNLAKSVEHAIPDGKKHHAGLGVVGIDRVVDIDGGVNQGSMAHQLAWESSVAALFGFNTAAFNFAIILMFLMTLI